MFVIDHLFVYMEIKQSHQEVIEFSVLDFQLFKFFFRWYVLLVQIP